MMNLAGNPRCDAIIARELERARIPAVPCERYPGEVAYSIEGRLGPFAFRRAWRYWVVNGPVPMGLARTLYADPVGREDIRVSGHCGCPSPDEWVTCRDPDRGFVELYHIDSEVGLRIFVDAIRPMAEPRPAGDATAAAGGGEGKP